MVWAFLLASQVACLMARPALHREACSFLAEEGLKGRWLLAAMAAAAGVLYNHSGQLTCFDYR